MLNVPDCKMMGYRFPNIGEETFVHPNARVMHTADFRKPYDDDLRVSDCQAKVRHDHKARKVRSSEWRRRK